MAMTPNDPPIAGGTDGTPLLTAQFIAASTIYGTNDPTVVLDALIAFLNRRHAHAELGLIGAARTPPQVRIVASYAQGDRVHADSSCAR